MLRDIRDFIAVILANGIEFAERDDGFREELNPSNGIFGFVIARSDRDEAIHTSASGAMDCFASLAMTMWGEQARQIDPTGKSAKSCQAPRTKIFLFSNNPNQWQIIAIPSRERGVGHRHERWDGLRWTRQRCARKVIAGRLSVSDLRRARRATLRRTAKPCGPGTRCWCQVGGGVANPTGFRNSINSSTTVTRRIRRRGERDISRKAIAQGMY